MDKKINRKSASKWEQSAERVLIEVWADKMEQLRGCRKNSHILIEMAAQMESNGYKYSPEELKTKMHNMTNRYRKERLKIGSTGGSPSEWELYKDMENLLAPFKSYHSEGLVVGSIKTLQEISLAPLSVSATDLSTTDLSPSSTVSTAPPLSPSSSPISPKLCRTEKKKKKENIDRLIKSVEVAIENINNTSEKMMAIENEKKDILKKFAEKEADVQNALLEFLKQN